MKTDTSLLKRWEFWIGALGVLQFGVASLAWCVFLGFGLMIARRVEWDGVVYVLLRLLPCLALAALFAAALKRLKSDRARARRLVLWGLLAATALFAYDIRTRNYQIQQTTDAGCTHLYIGWLWLDDAWSPWR